MRLANISLKFFISVIFLISLISHQSRSQVDDGLRYRCSNFCESCYHQRDICEKCAEKFYFHEFFKVCLVGEISGCKVYSSRIVCSVCEEGYRNIRGTCQKCTLNRCGKCEASLGVCEQCRTGFTFSGLVASGSNCETLCQVANCKKCFNGSGNFCETCNEGYRKTPSDSCEKCDMEGCSSCATIKSTCDSTCLSSYYWTTSKCVVCMTGCSKCSATGICVGCDTANRYYMNNERRCVLMGRLKKALSLLLLMMMGFVWV